jgi:hypothetical protein
MAGALRPVVLLMLVASALFVVDGVLDGVYPGGPAWFTGKYQNLAEIAYIFAILNTLVAYLVARGSERSLIARIGLSAFFVVERPLTAFVLGPKELPAVIVHLVTAVVELVILVTAVRVWRLGHSIGEAEMSSLFGLQSSSPMPVPADDEDEPSPRQSSPGLPPKTAWLLGIITILLAGSSWPTVSFRASCQADASGGSLATLPDGSSISSRSSSSPSPHARCMAARSHFACFSRPRCCSSSSAPSAHSPFASLTRSRSSSTSSRRSSPSRSHSHPQVRSAAGARARITAPHPSKRPDRA